MIRAVGNYLSTYLDSGYAVQKSISHALANIAGKSSLTPLSLNIKYIPHLNFASFSLQLPQPFNGMCVRRADRRAAAVTGHPRPVRGRRRLPELPAQHRGDQLQQVQADLLQALREEVG